MPLGDYWEGGYEIGDEEDLEQFTKNKQICIIKNEFIIIKISKAHSLPYSS